MRELFTVSHSNHTIEHFLDLLTRCGVSAIADVRSSPYSEYSPQFDKKILEQRLANLNLEYVFLGRELGARRSEPSCYVDGQAKYDIIRNLPAFSQGLAYVLEGIERSRVALLCAEADPLMCHRTILICRELKAARTSASKARIGRSWRDHGICTDERLRTICSGMWTRPATSSATAQST